MVHLPVMKIIGNGLQTNLIFENDEDCGFFELEPYNDLFRSWDVRSLKQLES